MTVLRLDRAKEPTELSRANFISEKGKKNPLHYYFCYRKTFYLGFGMYFKCYHYRNAYQSHLIRRLLLPSLLKSSSVDICIY